MSAPCDHEPVGYVKAGDLTIDGRFCSAHTCRDCVPASREYVTDLTGLPATDLVPYGTPQRSEWMTPAKVRAKAIDTIAQAFYEAVADDELMTTGTVVPTWERANLSETHSARGDARMAVDALLKAEIQLRAEAVSTDG